MEYNLQLTNQFFGYLSRQYNSQNGENEQEAVYDVFFRKNPAESQFSIVSGIDDFHAIFESISKKASQPLKDQILKIDIRSVKEGTIIFPYEPLFEIKGPQSICSLLKDIIKRSIEYPTFITTNAYQFRKNAQEKMLIDSGIRRSRTIEDAIRATKYSLRGGFDKTTNYYFKEKISALYDYACILGFNNLEEIKDHSIKQSVMNLVNQGFSRGHEGELTAFIAIAMNQFENKWYLLDTYNTIHSGLSNFKLIEKATKQYQINNGIHVDIEHPKKLCQKIKKEISNKTPILASNNISVQSIKELSNSNINAFSVATPLISPHCHSRWNLEYKPVEINGAYTITGSVDKKRRALLGQKSILRSYEKPDHVLSKGDYKQDLLQKTWKKEIIYKPTTEEKIKQYIFEQIKRFEDTKNQWDTIAICDKIKKLTYS